MIEVISLLPVTGQPRSRAIAAVRLPDGIEIHHLRVVEDAAGRFRVRLPCLRNSDGEWTPAVRLGEERFRELSAAVIAEFWRT